jgi:predicted DNA-binding protein with PD1-like motif
MRSKLIHDQMQKTYAVVGRRDGSACGGHLMDARVWPTLEVILTESPRHLERKYDRESGLALIDI